MGSDKIFAAIVCASLFSVCSAPFGLCDSAGIDSSQKSPLVVEQPHETRPIDWRCGSISSRLRQHLKPAPTSILGQAAWLRQQFGDQKITCALTIKADGSLVDVSIVNSSGSDVMDSKAVELIKSASPFHRAWDKTQVDQSFAVEFPQLTVKFIK